MMSYGVTIISASTLHNVAHFYQAQHRLAKLVFILLFPSSCCCGDLVTDTRWANCITRLAVNFIVFSLFLSINYLGMELNRKSIIPFINLHFVFQGAQPTMLPLQRVTCPSFCVSDNLRIGMEIETALTYKIHIEKDNIEKHTLTAAFW